MAFDIPLLGLMAGDTKKRPASAKSKTSFYDVSMVSLDGKPVDFNTFRGKKVLIVNVASRCGFAPQYEQLQALHEKYRDKLVIIGFPANNFLKQEPGSAEEIAGFCQRNYGVSFLMSEKISVRGKDVHPVFGWLTDKKKNGWNGSAPAWNFYKYLVNESGELEAVFSSRMRPDSPKLTKLIGKPVDGEIQPVD